MNESQKYGRSLHAQISLGTTSDDRFMSDGYVKAFADMTALRLSEKLDGQNNCFSKYGVFARSHTAPSIHPWDKPMIDRWQLFKNDLGDLEVFGENMYATHSIRYTKLESFFYVFGVRDKGVWLSWEEVCFYAGMLDFPTVPTIEIKVPLKEFYKSDANENKLLQDWFKVNLGMTWEESTRTAGLLGGIDIVTGKPASEGFVVNGIDGGSMNSGVLPVEHNEFNTLFKVVREGHVNTDEHWTQNWKPGDLIDYEKYKWFGHEYLTKKAEERELQEMRDRLASKDSRSQDIGKIVRYDNETGIVLYDPEYADWDSIFVRWDTNKENDYEGYGGLPYIFLDSYDFKYINKDGTLKEEFKIQK